MMPDTVPQHVREIQAIAAVPRVLETVATMTGLGFICIAHVTDTTWTTCAVHDQLGFGLQAGDPLDVTTTLCEEVRATREPIVIDSGNGYHLLYHIDLPAEAAERRTARSGRDGRCWPSSCWPRWRRAR